MASEYAWWATAYPLQAQAHTITTRTRRIMYGLEFAVQSCSGCFGSGNNCLGKHRVSLIGSLHSVRLVLMTGFGLVVVIRCYFINGISNAFGCQLSYASGLYSLQPDSQVTPAALARRLTSEVHLLRLVCELLHLYRIKVTNVHAGGRRRFERQRQGQSVCASAYLASRSLQLACRHLNSALANTKQRVKYSAIRQQSAVQRVKFTLPPRFVQLRASEDAAATTTESPSEVQSNGAVEDPEQIMSPLDLARQALEADEIDKSLMSELLAELEGEIFDLRDQLANSAGSAAKTEVLETSLTATKDQLVRLTADFENFRKRTAAEKDELSSRAKGDVVASLLPLVDNFELARTQVKAETEGEQQINNSYQGLYKQMVDIMKGLGVDAVETVGAPFNPELHEAIMREPNDEVPDDTVIMEFRKGFRMGDRLLRPAMVKVSFREAAEASSADTDSEPNSIDEQ